MASLEEIFDLHYETVSTIGFWRHLVESLIMMMIEKYCRLCVTMVTLIITFIFIPMNWLKTFVSELFKIADIERKKRSIQDRFMRLLNFVFGIDQQLRVKDIHVELPTIVEKPKKCLLVSKRIAPSTWPSPPLPQLPSRSVVVKRYSFSEIMSIKKLTTKTTGNYVNICRVLDKEQRFGECPMEF